MNINLQEIVQKEIEKLDKDISINKLKLEGLCKQRQEVAVLLEAYSKYDLHDDAVEREMKDVENNISGFLQVIELKTKRLNALQDYKLKLQDSNIYSSEERSIEDKYPIIRI